MNTMTNRLSCLSVSHGLKESTDPKTGKKTFTAIEQPPRYITVKETVKFPRVDGKGQPVKGTQEFTWLGQKVFTELYDKEIETVKLNPVYFEIVREDPNNEKSRVISVKHYDFITDAKEESGFKRVELKGATGNDGKITAIRTAEQHNNAIMHDRMNNLENMLREALGKKETEVKIDDTGLTDEERSWFAKIKSKIGLAIVFFIIALSVSSCTTSQSILKNGCTVREFAIVKQDTIAVSSFINTTDSVGVYMVCDNAKLSKSYPNVAAKLLGYYNRLKTTLLSK